MHLHDQSESAFECRARRFSTARSLRSLTFALIQCKNILHLGGFSTAKDSSIKVAAATDPVAFDASHLSLRFIERRRHTDADDDRVAFRLLLGGEDLLVTLQRICKKLHWLTTVMVAADSFESLASWTDRLSYGRALRCYAA